MTNWIPSWRNSGKPKYIELADIIANDIEEGVLVSGDRLPAQRKVADLLGVDFTTISRGYSEAQSRGLVVSHVGRGTFVAETEVQIKKPDERRASDIDLAMNLPPEPTDIVLLSRMRAGMEAVSADLIGLLRYQSATGSEVDKEAAAVWLSMRGMVPSLDRVSVTPGAHATMVAILLILAKPGDTILAEAVTYAGIRTIAARLGLNLVGVPVDEEGIIPEALEAAIEEHAPRALYLNPTLNNPTTKTIPSQRRIQLADVLLKNELQLIEDDAYGFIPANPPAPFATYAPNLTWHIGGLAKCIGAGLRIAYTVSPNGKAAFALEQMLRTTSVMPSPIAAALATRWIQDGTADRIRAFIRSETNERQKIANDVLSGFHFSSDPNAFNIWLELEAGQSRADLVGRMAGKGIGLMVSDTFTVLGEPKNCVRVCLGGKLSREELRSGLEFLSNTLDHSIY